MSGEVAICDMEECPMCHDQLISCSHSMWRISKDKKSFIGRAGGK